ncbi:MAG TPA: DegT/DnrJ/EryC1/StrS family aminotransferase [Ignavibacteria bacterium]|nr:DegT/DnrJ/EryC1/StrS family aminotransferase [Ignavibacteria bacterium]
MINVTKTYLPPVEEYFDKIRSVWDNNWITNQGPLAEELEAKLKDHLGVKNLLLVSNGTIALQLAIKALELKNEIITTPYSYVATTSSILWENCTPVFCDIEDKTFCINADKIEELITEKTTGILATNVYGFPCDYDKIKSIAGKYGLKVIYDGAHSFGVKINGESVFNSGDISTVSFHATKLFHTIEGGAIITNDEKLSAKMFLYRAFGHLDDDHYSVGINGRTSEFNAAMGLCNLPMVNIFINRRKEMNLLYRNLLNDTGLKFPVIPGNTEYNYSYFPVIFSSEEQMHFIKNKLADNNINARRYFYPSLNKLPYLKGNSCPVSESIAVRVLCLPLYHELSDKEIEGITKIISVNLK